MKPWYGLLVIFVVAGGARAELVELKVLEREPYADGKAYGDVGPYEKIVGIAKFALDPDHPKNKPIVDRNLVIPGSAVVVADVH